MGLIYCPTGDHMVDKSEYVEINGDDACEDCAFTIRPDCTDCLGTGTGGYEGKCSSCKGVGTHPSPKEKQDREEAEQRPRGDY